MTPGHACWRWYSVQWKGPVPEWCGLWLQVYRALVRGEQAAIKLVPLDCHPGEEDQALPSSAQGLSALLESDDQRVAALRRELAVIVRGWQKLEHVCK